MGHSVSMEERSRVKITGVEDVDCFSEEMAVITTALGDMTVSGSALKVARLDIASGEVELEGQIDGIEYGAARKSGFFGRVFR